MSDLVDTRGKVDLIIFDFDGVLTDNAVFVFEDGREAVRCNRADGLAFDMFRAAGIPVAIMSTERNLVVRARGDKLKVPVIQAVADKGAAIQALAEERGVNLERIMFVGNDLNDLSAMRLVGYPVSVADGHETVRRTARIVLAAKGGEGAARELAEIVFGLGGDL